MIKALTKEQFIEKYINNHTKVKIICPDHGIFEQEPNNHLNGCKCKKCGVNFTSTNDFIRKAKNIHGDDKYDYSLVEYKNCSTKVKIICKEHGIFEQIPNAHLNKKGCVYCGGKLKLTNKEIIKKFHEHHGNKYDYSLVNYKNLKTKINH